MDLFEKSGIALSRTIVLVFVFTLMGCGNSEVNTKLALPVNSLPVTEVPPVEVPPVSTAPPPTFYNPDLGTALSVGFYSSGSIKFSEEFPDSGVGFYKLFLPRDRGWTTRSLINIVMKASADVVAQFPNGGRLQIGDASKQFGGYASGHASHQNGLDVDLQYYSINRREQNPNATNGFDESFVKNGVVTSNFDRVKNWAFFKSMVGSGKIARIFVDPAIKKSLCTYQSTVGATEVLRRIRPYSNHANHMHVRIKCPANSPSCVAQSEVSSGSGCNTASTMETQDDEFGDDHET